MKRIMKFWVPILLLLLAIGIAIAWRTRERFETTQCDGMGYEGQAGDGTLLRLFSKSECDELGGNWSANGECAKAEGGSWSWDCRNAALPSEEPAETTTTTETAATETTADTETTTTTETTGGGTDTTASTGGVTPATVWKNNVLGPVFTSYGAPVERSSLDSSKANQYPELLGGGDPKSREKGQGGAAGGGIGDLTGSMPTPGGLGSTEESKFFPTSRQPGDMDLIPDPYRVSQQFSTSSYSFKTEPTPFLTDFSAFSR